jgi:SAM-dependent methyltransferase
LYRFFESGLPKGRRKIRSAEALGPWFEHCVEAALGASPEGRKASFTWLDVGAGAGEVSELLSRRCPAAQGVAVDLHERPADLPDRSNLGWERCDVNEVGFSARLSHRADIVLAISVWEHVLDPSALVRDLLALLRPAGTLYLACPDFGSLARRLLRTRWPFFLPGEHLNMPTIEGTRRCLESGLDGSAWRREEASLRIRRIGLPYSVQYYLQYLGLRRLSGLVPPSLAVAFPAGALEATVTVGAQTTSATSRAVW